MNIAVINNKGGTGKTTTCVNLAAAMAGKHCRVLLVDLDAQASTSLSMGIGYHDLTPSMADVLFESVQIVEALRPTPIPGLDLLTGGMDLAHSDLILSDTPGRENRLWESLQNLPTPYDYVIFDCPPSLSLLSINAIIAADTYIIPLTAEYLALEGLISMMQAIEEVKAGMDVERPMMGIVFTMIIPGLKTAQEIIRLVREEYGTKVFSTVIRRNVRLTEAPSFGKSIFQYDPRSLGAKDYKALATEVQERCGGIHV
jgi:chromosome partitioning protein